MRRPLTRMGGLLILALAWTLAQAAEQPSTVAVIDFANNSLTDRESYEPLSHGLSAALSTELSHVEGLDMVERSRIRQVAQEIGLQASGIVDDRTAGQIGRILGARYLLLGSYMVMGKKVRIDVRMVETETTRLVKAEQVTGNTSDLLRLVGRLADVFADRLGKKVMPPAGSGVSEAAFAHYGMGIRLEDAGDLDMARREYAEAMRIDPDFALAAEALSRAESRLRAESRTTLVRATGTHSLDVGREKAREGAIEDALRAAVQRSSGRLMGSDSLAAYSGILGSEVLPRARGYVRDFTVSGERDSARVLLVDIEAHVARGVLEEDLMALGILQPAWAHPRVMIVVEEDAHGAEFAIPGGGREPTHSEMSLQGMLTERGFRVIDVAQYRRTLQAIRSDPAVQDLGAYALTQGADLVVFGRVAVSGGGVVGSYGIDNMRTSTAEGTFQILRADNAQVIGTVSDRGVGADPQAVQSGLVAIRKMCDAVGPKLERELIRLAREEVYGSRIVVLEVRGIRNQADVTTIERTLRAAIDGVQSVVQRGRERETARFEITFEGQSAELARQINRVSFGPLKVIVEESGLGLIRTRVER